LIKINVTEKNTGVLKISLSGHAGLNERGKDIVCAGVSALFFALVKTDGVEVCEKNGAYIITVPPEKRLCGEMAINGWRMIAEEYPMNAECEVQNVE
jgi:uncharacterized protein YsxB (DUF464 family)